MCQLLQLTGGAGGAGACGCDGVEDVVVGGASSTSAVKTSRIFSLSSQIDASQSSR